MSYLVLLVEPDRQRKQHTKRSSDAMKYTDYLETFPITEFLL